MEIVASRLDTAGIRQFQKLTHKNKSAVVRVLVEAGRKHQAVELYKEKKVSLGLGARLAGVRIGEFFELLAEHNVDLNVTIDDVRAGLKAAEKALA